MSVAETGKAEAQPWVTVGAYANGWEADLALGLLQAEGLPAHLENREFVGMDWTLAAAVGWIKVQVPGDVAEAARAVLAKMEGSGRAGDLHLGPGQIADAEECLRCGGPMPVGDGECDACGWSYGDASPEPVDEELTPQQRWDRMQDQREAGAAIRRQMVGIATLLAFCVGVALLASWLLVRLLGGSGF